MLTVTAARLETAVADAAARSFAKLGETVVTMPLVDLLAEETAPVPGAAGRVPAVVAPDLRRVECVAGAGDLDVVAALAPALGAADWRVVVLVPAPAAGQAHRALRGMPVLIQPWWPAEDGTPCFGRPEIP